MKPKDLSSIAEARIQEAQRRGELDNLPGAGRPLPADDLAGLSYEDRIAALIHRSSGGAPEEVELIRETAALRERIAQTTDPTERQALSAELRKKALRLAALFESSGRYLLAKSDLTRSE
jgi:hypothetical protein